MEIWNAANEGFKKQYLKRHSALLLLPLLLLACSKKKESSPASSSGVQSESPSYIGSWEGSNNSFSVGFDNMVSSFAVTTFFSGRFCSGIVTATRLSQK